MLGGVAGRGSKIGQLTCDGEEPFDVDEREQAPLAIPGDFRVFASCKARAHGVRADIEKRAQIAGAVMPLVRHSKLVQFGRQVSSIWF